MVKYALDLAKTEQKLGHRMSILYPGTIYKRNSTHVRIKKAKEISNMEAYVILNPLPIPLASGIKDCAWYASQEGYSAYLEFLKAHRPDVIHVHSLMGIHESFFEAANHLGIRLVYTSHDYFGLCPTTTLQMRGEVCAQTDWSACAFCCQHAFSAAHLILDQSVLVQKTLQTRLGKATLDFLTIEKQRFLGTGKAQPQDGTQVTQHTCVEKEEKRQMLQGESIELIGQRMEYLNLSEYYKKIFRRIDFYHFNSEIAQEEFEKRIGQVAHVVLPITSCSVTDKRRKRSYNGSLRVGYLGADTQAKGFPVLYRCMQDLQEEKQSIVLNTYFGIKKSGAEFWHQHRPYRYEELEKIMDENDVILVPSTWRETFGLVVLEALSFGVPVVVSENVGAQILLKGKKAMGCILKGELHTAIRNCLREMSENKEVLRLWNRNICEAELDFSMEDHAMRIVEFCYR